MPNAWAASLIEESCTKDKKDELDAYGMMYKGAMAAIPQAVSMFTSFLGLSDTQAASMGSMAEMIVKCIDPADEEKQKESLKKLSEDTGIEKDILMALSTTDPEAISLAAEQFGAKELYQAVNLLNSPDTLSKIAINNPIAVATFQDARDQDIEVYRATMIKMHAQMKEN